MMGRTMTMTKKQMSESCRGSDDNVLYGVDVGLFFFLQEMRYI